jgi:hypothetical protein
MKECDKRNSHINGKLHMIYISSIHGRHPITKTFTALHSTALHLSTLHFYLLKLHSTTLHNPLIWLNPTHISCRFISPHIITLHLTSLHCTFKRFIDDIQHILKAVSFLISIGLVSIALQVKWYCHDSIDSKY